MTFNDSSVVILSSTFKKACGIVSSGLWTIVNPPKSQTADTESPLSYSRLTLLLSGWDVVAGGWVFLQAIHRRVSVTRDSLEYEVLLCIYHFHWTMVDSCALKQSLNTASLMCCMMIADNVEILILWFFVEAGFNVMSNEPSDHDVQKWELTIVMWLCPVYFFLFPEIVTFSNVINSP